MTDRLLNHWAVCYRDGSLAYDEFGQAEVWESRTAARGRSALITGSGEWRTHVEKVRVRREKVTDEAL